MSDSTTNVLIVDDDPVVQMLLAAVVGRTGWSVETADDGSLAIAALERRSFSLVVTDLNMPVVDGAALLAHVRANPATSRIPVVVLTATTDSATVEALLAAGASACIAKPIDPRTFGDRLREVLRAAQ